MDWSKAKTIFIFMLLLLNAFLFASIVWSNTSYHVKSEYIKHTEAYLKAKNITLKTKIPAYAGDTGSIDYKNRPIAEEKIVKYLFPEEIKPEAVASKRIWQADGKTLEIGNNHIRFIDSNPKLRMTYDNPHKLCEEIRQFLKDMELLQNDIELEDIKNTGSGLIELRFVEKYRGHLLFDNYLKVIVSSSGINSFDMVARDVEKIIGAEEILSAYQIMVVGKIPENSVITSISFGYKRSKEEELYDSPVWRIEYDNDAHVFYNAYTGVKLE